MSAAATNEPRPEKKATRARGGGGGGAAKTAGIGASSNATKLKIHARRLPPAMTEQEFKIHTAEWIDFESIEHFSFVKGKVSEEYVSLPSPCGLVKANSSYRSFVAVQRLLLMLEH